MSQNAPEELHARLPLKATQEYALASIDNSLGNFHPLTHAQPYKSVAAT